MSVRKIQSTITLGALLLALAHLIWPSLTIDGITLSLIVIAIIPWLAPLLKSLKLPGGVEVEFKDLEETKVRLEETGLLPPAQKAPPSTYSFLVVAREDPRLALTGLRIEIEKRLIVLAEKTGGQPRVKGVGGYLFHLRDKGVLTPEQHGVLADMVGILNSAVHGAEVRKDIAAWALDVGPNLLAELDRRIEQQT
jgi:hypothetical protein